MAAGLREQPWGAAFFDVMHCISCCSPPAVVRGAHGETETAYLLQLVGAALSIAETQCSVCSAEVGRYATQAPAISNSHAASMATGASSLLGLQGSVDPLSRCSPVIAHYCKLSASKRGQLKTGSPAVWQPPCRGPADGGEIAMTISLCSLYPNCTHRPPGATRCCAGPLC